MCKKALRRFLTYHFFLFNLNFYKMPEGPSVVLLEEEVRQFIGEK